MEVHAVHHGRASPGRGQAEPLCLRRLRRGNVDRRVGPAREAPLEAEVESLEGARVALVVDAVERVDGGRSGPPRGQTPVKPGALAVGVDDGSDLGPVLEDHGVHLPLGGRRPIAVHLVAVQIEDGDVLGL